MSPRSRRPVPVLPETQTAHMEFDDNGLVIQLFGYHNTHLARIEQRLDVAIQPRQAGQCAQHQRLRALALRQRQSLLEPAAGAATAVGVQRHDRHCPRMANHVAPERGSVGSAVLTDHQGDDRTLVHELLPELGEPRA